MRRWQILSILLLCLTGGLMLLIYPLSIIQPFRHQSTDELQHALFVFRIAPMAGAGIALLAIAITVAGWRKVRLGFRIVATLIVLITCAIAFLVRVNVFERMFHPAGAPRFLAVRNAKLDPDDMLITVALNNDAHAYPIREMGYHHVVNDFVGAVPIVATY